MSPVSASQSLALVKKHLARAQASWDPPEWLDLAAYGLYALEAAAVAAALHRGYPMKRTHWSKADAVRDLAAKEGLPDVSGLMRDLNEVRKAEAYGDIASPPSLVPQDVVREVERYVAAVDALLAR
jgi:hypothetical protein